MLCALGGGGDPYLSLSAKLQPNYCPLRSTLKHSQSGSLKDTISSPVYCLLVNSESPSCFKSTNHRAVMNSNWFSMQRSKTKITLYPVLIATVFQLRNKREIALLSRAISGKEMGSSRNFLEPLKYTSRDPITHALWSSVPITAK